MACSLFFASLQDIQKEMEENGKVQRCFDCCWTVVGLVWCSETNCVQTCLLLLDSVGPQGFVDPVSEQRWWWLEGGAFGFGRMRSFLRELAPWQHEMRKAGFSDLVFLPRIHYIYICIYIYLSLSLFLFLVGIVNELGRIAPAFVDRPDQAAVRSRSFFDHQKRKLPVWERFLGSDRYVPGL